MYQETSRQPPVDTGMRKIYGRLWKLPTVPRIRQFLLKAISNFLSTKDVLGSAIVGDDTLCPLCELQEETATHLILHCNFSRAVWFAVLGWTSDNNGSLSEWIISWFDSLFNGTITGNDLVSRAIIAWNIWMERCAKAFNNSNASPDAIIQKCKNMVSEHSNRITIPSQLTPRINLQNVNWIPPPISFLTLNCDGSFDYNNLLGGIGLIIRNFACMQQEARCISMNEARSAEQVECMGLWSSVQWAKDLKLERVHFEMDAKVVVDAVNNDNSAMDWRLLNIILDIKNLFQILVLGNSLMFLKREIK
ncbi:uncharacterized protein LOC113332698 [Papaver somniferum]|uniref:uncharacterized protein LOC113332698 n=1 Tax=Papaver somniferum TaxID=3469 RepID=UPI000E70318C|nr:uncharacterized protein LOC113332698 [Papaver somniferum]